jgi:hypothetical protein
VEVGPWRDSRGLFVAFQSGIVGLGVSLETLPLARGSRPDSSGRGCGTFSTFSGAQRVSAPERRSPIDSVCHWNLFVPLSRSLSEEVPFRGDERDDA